MKPKKPSVSAVMLLTVSGLASAAPAIDKESNQVKGATEIVRPNCAKAKQGIVRPNCLKDKQQIVRPNCLKEKKGIVRPNCIKEKAPQINKPKP